MNLHLSFPLHGLNCIQHSPHLDSCLINIKSNVSEHTPLFDLDTEETLFMRCVTLSKVNTKYIAPTEGCHPPPLM